MGKIDSSVASFINGVSGYSKEEIKQQIGAFNGRVVEFLKNLPSLLGQHKVVIAQAIAVFVVGSGVIYGLGKMIVKMNKNKAIESPKNDVIKKKEEELKLESKIEVEPKIKAAPKPVELESEENLGNAEQGKGEEEDVQKGDVPASISDLFSDSGVEADQKSNLGKGEEEGKADSQNKEVAPDKEEFFLEEGEAVGPDLDGEMGVDQNADYELKLGTILSYYSKEALEYCKDDAGNYDPEIVKALFDAIDLDTEESLSDPQQVPKQPLVEEQALAVESLSVEEKKVKAQPEKSLDDKIAEIVNKMIAKSEFPNDAQAAAKIINEKYKKNNKALAMLKFSNFLYNSNKNKLEQAQIKISSIFKMFKTKKQLKKEKLENNSVIKIQARFRGHLARLKIKKEKEAAELKAKLIAEKEKQNGKFGKLFTLASNKAPIGPQKPQAAPKPVQKEEVAPDVQAQQKAQLEAKKEQKAKQAAKLFELSAKANLKAKKAAVAAKIEKELVEKMLHIEEIQNNILELETEIFSQKKTLEPLEQKQKFEINQLNEILKNVNAEKEKLEIESNLVSRDKIKETIIKLQGQAETIANSIDHEQTYLGDQKSTLLELFEQILKLKAEKADLEASIILE